MKTANVCALNVLGNLSYGRVDEGATGEPGRPLSPRISEVASASLILQGGGERLDVAFDLVLERL
jgi:hypothetical protein